MEKNLETQRGGEGIEKNFDGGEPLTLSSLSTGRRELKDDNSTLEGKRGGGEEGKHYTRTSSHRKGVGGGGTKKNKGVTTRVCNPQKAHRTITRKKW